MYFILSYIVYHIIRGQFSQCYACVHVPCPGCTEIFTVLRAVHNNIYRMCSIMRIHCIKASASRSYLMSGVVAVNVSLGHRSDTWITSITGSVDRWQWFFWELGQKVDLWVSLFIAGAICFSGRSVESIHNTYSCYYSLVWIEGQNK